MKDRFEDARSKKTVFVSSCLLNTNNKVKGLGRFPGMCKEVVDTLYKYDLGINQMPCPETLYLGVNRWWATKNLYDSVGFRAHCKKLADQMVVYMVEYEKAGYETVAVLSSDGSPTCGVTLTSFDKNWGGSPVTLDYNDALIEGPGVFMEELKLAIETAGIKMPQFYGLALDDTSTDMNKIIEDFDQFIKGVCNS
jgi:predicted secreted protein